VLTTLRGRVTKETETVGVAAEVAVVRMARRMRARNRRTTRTVTTATLKPVRGAADNVVADAAVAADAVVRRATIISP